MLWFMSLFAFAAGVFLDWRHGQLENNDRLVYIFFLVGLGLFLAATITNP